MSRNKLTKRLVTVLLISILTTAFVLNTAYAADSNNIVETNFFGNFEDDGQGCGVYRVLNLAVDILSIGIGILGVIGITVVGIQYLTAGGNEQKTTKAKQRIVEIIIGIIAFVALYALTQWLLPAGRLNTNMDCRTVSDEEIAEMKADEQTAASEQTTTHNNPSDTKEPSPSKEKPTSVAAKAKNAALRQKINDTGVALAWPSTKNPVYKEKPTSKFAKAMKAINSNKNETGCRAKGQSCGMFVGTVIRYSGVDKKIPTMASKIYKYVRGVGQYKSAKKSGKKKWKELKKKKNAQPGDIALILNDSYTEAKHVAMYVKNKKGKTVTAEGSLCHYYGVIKSKKRFTNWKHAKIYRFVGN